MFAGVRAFIKYAKNGRHFWTLESSYIKGIIYYNMRGEAGIIGQKPLYPVFLAVFFADC
jgi:hypothetical protein